MFPTYSCPDTNLPLAVALFLDPLSRGCDWPFRDELLHSCQWVCCAFLDICNHIVTSSWSEFLLGRWFAYAGFLQIVIPRNMEMHWVVTCFRLIPLDISMLFHYRIRFLFNRYHHGRIKCLPQACPRPKEARRTRLDADNIVDKQTTQTAKRGLSTRLQVSTVKDCNCKVQMTQFEQLGNKQQRAATNKQMIEEQSPFGLPFRLVKSGRLSSPCP